MKKGIAILLLLCFATLSGCVALPAEEEMTQSREEITAEKFMQDMTLSDMIYQMMFINPEVITGVGTVIQAGEATKAALQKYPVGGMVYFAANLKDREQTITMINNTQSYAKIPLFIGVDEEGGQVARVGQNSLMGTTKLPPMKEIGATGDPEKAYEAGALLAAELQPLGFNMDFAPVADVLIDERNTEIGNRSFGTDAQNVAAMVKSQVQGMEEAGLSSTLKHFPGHGSTTVNSHTGYSESKRTMEELKAEELLPFVAGIEAGVDFIMVSHMTLTAATEEKVPCSVSKEVIGDLLLQELGYEGIVITDSFQMGAITEMYTNGEAAVKAVLAGVDMILMPPDVEAAHTAILQAVEKGEIPQSRIEESVKKILNLKIQKGLLK